MSSSAPDVPTGILEAAAGDELTLSFADPVARLYGQVRTGRAPDGTESLLVLVLNGEGTVAAHHQRVLPGDAGPAPVQLQAPSGGRRSVHFGGRQDGAGAFALSFQALSPPAGLMSRHGGDLRAAASRQQLCRVSGSVQVGGATVAVAGVGQIGVTPDAAAAGTTEMRREVDGWLGDDLAVCARAVRARRGTPHEQEWLGALLFEGEPPVGNLVDDPRLSTTYDGDGLQLRAGLELWVTEEADFPRRAAGETVAAGHLMVSGQDGGPLRWDCAFLSWHMEGRRGIGPYSILRVS